MPRLALLLCAIILAACTNDANHLGNPLTLPGRAIGNSISEAAYAARRKPVEDYVAAHHGAIIGELKGAGGAPLLTGAMDVAKIPVGRRAALEQEFRRDIALYESDPEAMVVTLMVYS